MNRRPDSATPDDYAGRVKAVEDAIRLRWAMSRPKSQESATYTTVAFSTGPLDQFDVLELARFLLGIEDDGSAVPV